MQLQCGVPVSAARHLNAEGKEGRPAVAEAREARGNGALREWKERIRCLEIPGQRKGEFGRQPGIPRHPPVGVPAFLMREADRQLIDGLGRQRRFGGDKVHHDVRRLLPAPFGGINGIDPAVGSGGVGAQTRGADETCGDCLDGPLEDGGRMKHGVSSGN